MTELIALIALLASPQKIAPKPLVPILAPTLPYGINQSVASAIYDVERAAAEGDFAKAHQLQAFCPRQIIRVQIDLTNVPDRLKDVFARRRDYAVQDWQVGAPFRFIPVDCGPADIKIEFADVLRKPEGAAMPLGLAEFWSTDPSQPRLDAVIGLHRGSPLVETTDQQVQNEIEFALGQYLGVAKLPIVGGAMYRLDSNTPLQSRVISFERVIAARVQEVLEDLDTDLAKKQPLKLNQPTLSLDPGKISGSDILQGTHLNWVFQVSNIGTGELETRIIPDCSCFSTDDPVHVKAGDGQLMRVNMSTMDYSGPTYKELYVLTNDPSKPALTIPVKLNIVARYAFVYPHGTGLLLGPSGADTSFKMLVDGAPFQITDAHLEGVKGSITFAPLAKDGGKSGYVFDLHVDPSIPPGQAPFGIAIATTDPKFPVIRTSFTAQKGIVAIPDNLYLGNIAPLRQSFTVRLVRPGKPFHVLKLSADSPYIHVSQESVGDGSEHDITVVIKANAPSGDFSAFVQIGTDDPAQKTITVPISGTVS